MTGFYKLGDIAGAVADAIRNECPALRKVSVAAATNGSQLWQAIDALTAVPSAIVCVGVVRYEDSGLTREIQLIVALADGFRTSTGARAAGVWAAAEEVAAIFEPRGGPANFDAVEIGGVEWSVSDMTPGAGSERTGVVYLNLKGTEIATIPLSES